MKWPGSRSGPPYDPPPASLAPPPSRVGRSFLPVVTRYFPTPRPSPPNNLLTPLHRRPQNTARNEPEPRLQSRKKSTTPPVFILPHPVGVFRAPSFSDAHEAGCWLPGPISWPRFGGKKARLVRLVGVGLEYHYDPPAVSLNSRALGRGATCTPSSSRTGQPADHGSSAGIKESATLVPPWEAWVPPPEPAETNPVNGSGAIGPEVQRPGAKEEGARKHRSPATTKNFRMKLVPPPYFHRLQWGYRRTRTTISPHSLRAQDV